MQTTTFSKVNKHRDKHKGSASATCCAGNKAGKRDRNLLDRKTMAKNHSQYRSVRRIYHCVLKQAVTVSGMSLEQHSAHVLDVLLDANPVKRKIG